MNLIQSIKSIKSKNLQILLDDEVILIKKLGSYENKIWYSWSAWGPTDSPIPHYKSEVISKEEILPRINLLDNIKTLEKELLISINHFLET